MPRGKRAESTEQLILEAAIERFSERSYRETPLQDIADDLGITRPLLYYYFRSKGELLWRIVRDLGDELYNHVAPVIADAGPVLPRFREAMFTHARLVLSNPDPFRIYFAEGHLVGTRRHRQLRNAEDRYLKLLSEVLEEGQALGVIAPGDSRLMARLVTGMANSSLRWYRVRGKANRLALSSAIADMAARAVANPASKA